MIRRRAFLQGAATAVLAVPRVGHAAPARRIPRVGVLGDVNPVPWTVSTPAVELECRWAGGRPRELSRLAADLVRLDVDVIVAAGAPAAHAARNATRTIPIVFVAGDEPGAEGRLASLAGRDGNVTGLTVPSDAEVARQRLTMLRRAAPGLRGVTVLSNPDEATAERAVAHLRSMGARMALETRPLQVRTVEQVVAALGTPRGADLEGIVVLPDPLFEVHASRLVEAAARMRRPTLYPARSFVEAGGLMALHGDLAEVIRRAASIVARLLAGTPPRAVPVQSLTSLTLTLNLATARTLGPGLSSSLLARADVVIGA